MPAPPGVRQANYEIQVYGAETVPPQTLMVELHSNFTVKGQQATVDGVYPTDHQEHETLELTEGLNDWSEVGFYLFTSEQDGHGVQWVGDHIARASVCPIPGDGRWSESLHRDRLSTFRLLDRHLDLEIRPIIDKSIGRWYFAVNPHSSAPCMGRT